MINFFKKHKHEIILAILICIYIAYFTLACFLRHDNFYTGRFDLGNMDQTVWNTLHGRIFQTSTDSGIVISRLSAHADFILILLSPFYLLWSNPKMLLLIQTIVLAFGAIFVYLITKEVFKNKNFALLFGFLFLLNPWLNYVNLYDFHPVALATTFLLAAFYYLIKRRYALLIVFLILAGITKEQVWLIAFIFGLYLIFQKIKKTRLLGLGISAASLAIFYYLVSYAIPQNAGGQHFALKFFSDYGDTPISVISNVIFSPQKLFSITFEASRLEYLKQLFIPLGFTSILSPFSLVFAIPDLLINLLSSNDHFHQIYYQYSSNITPFIFISSILGVKKIIKWFPKISSIFIASYLLIFTLLSAFLYGPLPATKYPNLDMFTKPQKNKEIIDKILSEIPENNSVSATNNLGSHLSHREKVSTIPLGFNDADYVLFLQNNGYSQIKIGSENELIDSLRHNSNYLKVFEKDDFVVFKKVKVLL